MWKRSLNLELINALISHPEGSMTYVKKIGKKREAIKANCSNYWILLRMWREYGAKFVVIWDGPNIEMIHIWWFKLTIIPHSSNYSTIWFFFKSNLIYKLFHKFSLHNFLFYFSKSQRKYPILGKDVAFHKLVEYLNQHIS